METKISNKRLRELELAERKLQALENGGVDNWEWYDQALGSFIKDIEAEERLEELLVDLEVALLNGAFEPSERGAGYSATDSAREDALGIIKLFLEEYDKLKQ